MDIKNKNFDEAYTLFAKVVLIYLVKEIKNLTGHNTAYEINEISYLKPAKFDKENFLYTIKNNISTIKDYHESIRFIIKEKDFNAIKLILEKNGYKNFIETFIKIISKSAIGMSIISGKKINNKFVINDFTSAYDLGHEEKFLAFTYKISIKGYPDFFIVQIVHEAVFEYFKKTFLSEIKLELPFIDFIKYVSEPAVNFFNSLLKENYFFYPEKVEIKDNVKFKLYEINDCLNLKINAENLRFDLYCLYNSSDMDKFTDKKINTAAEIKNQIDAFIHSDIFLKKTNELKIKFKKLNNDSIKTNGILIYYSYGSDPFKPNKFYLYIPFEFINAFVLIISNNKKINITIGNIKNYLEALDKIIGKSEKNSKVEFKYLPKKNLKLAYKELDETGADLKSKKAKKINSIEDILNSDDKILQVALNKLKPKEIVVILKAGTKELKNKIFKNMSNKTKEFYTDEIKKQIKITRHEQKAYISKLLSILNNVSEKF